MNNYYETYDFPYDRYYLSQAGGGSGAELLTFYSGKPFQRYIQFYP